ncbi:MAG: Fur family transcriptional regulator [Rhodospirillales bacterium]|nr:transcriptional repressor [Rhodospirillaceae bacterium]MDP6429919.1 Fur family transcriptional regulator [Rhodospirillales bacterium]MDP6642631.1 Fur family transcriptional regulator [Rhodospirillales bacterium]MDP6840559.1 Fur family transcriptional regulator [Rhodospirillales bacterium]
MPSRLERICIERGMKMTGQRRIIARVLSESDDHPDVEELYRRSMEIDPKISIATVYRTVRLFEEAGLLDRLDFGDGRARYERTSDDHHDHLIDLHTGKVIEFHDLEVEKLQEKIAERYGFKLVGHRMELYGVSLGAKQTDAADD